MANEQLIHTPPGLRSALRIGLVVALGLASLIPLFIVDGIADERKGYFHKAQSEVASSWGQPAHLTGPLLIVPVDYVETQRSDGWRPEKPPGRTRKHIIVLPDELRVEASIDHQMRRRAIYEIALFSADVEIAGVFRNIRERVDAQLSAPIGRLAEVDWNGARLVLGVSDPRAIRLSSAEQAILWEGNARGLSPGAFESILGSSIQTAVSIPETLEEDGAAFELNLVLGTTGSFVVNALGGTTTYSLTSSWAHPSFSGHHSPIRRTLTDDGFTADWEVHGLARSLPDAWVHEDQQRSLSGQQMGVNFYNPVTAYTAIDRGIKYGLMFIALTFLTFFCVELISGVRFHVVQYGVVSLGLVMFYMTLLAASEHLVFSLSYILATCLIVGLLAGYTWALTKARLLTGLIVSVLLSLYCTLYILLQLEDFALLVGTGLLLTGLAALMFATRNLHRPGSAGLPA